MCESFILLITSRFLSFKQLGIYKLSLRIVGIANRRDGGRVPPFDIGLRTPTTIDIPRGGYVHRYAVGLLISPHVLFLTSRTRKRRDRLASDSSFQVLLGRTTLSQNSPSLFPKLPFTRFHIIINPPQLQSSLFLERGQRWCSARCIPPWPSQPQSAKELCGRRYLEENRPFNAANVGQDNPHPPHELITSEISAPSFIHTLNRSTSASSRQGGDSARVPSLTARVLIDTLTRCRTSYHL